MGLGCWEDCMSFWLVPNPIQIWITLNALVLYFVWFTYSRIDYNKLQLLLVILKFSPLFACVENYGACLRVLIPFLQKLKTSVDSPWWPWKCIMWYQFFGRCLDMRKYSCFKVMAKESNQKWCEPIDVQFDNMVEKSSNDY